MNMKENEDTEDNCFATDREDKDGSVLGEMWGGIYYPKNLGRHWSNQLKFVGIY